MRKLSLLILILLYGCSSKEREIESLFPKEFQKRLVETPGAILIDARTKEEMDVEFLKGAILIESGKPGLAVKLDSLDKSAPYFVYCARGVRSLTLLQLMKEKGFSQLYHLRGGIERWKAKGYPIEVGR